MSQLKLSIDSAVWARKSPSAPKSKSIQTPRGVQKPMDAKLAGLELESATPSCRGNLQNPWYDRAFIPKGSGPPER